jgi:hypothetical protein
MVIRHVVEKEEGFSGSDGPGHTIVCSCGATIQCGPARDLSPTDVRRLAHEEWTLHIRGL